MKILKRMVIIGWILFFLLEIIIYIAWQQQELPMLRHDRLATIPILLFLTIYYVFRLKSDD